MRLGNEMYDLILGIAQNDARIKAVYMNGSRKNLFSIDVYIQI